MCSFSLCYYYCVSVVMCLLFFFFFFSSRRRHTRCLSDWSSDVCSSDLPPWNVAGGANRPLKMLSHVAVTCPWNGRDAPAVAGNPPATSARLRERTRLHIGRASCRERVEISVGEVEVKKKKYGGTRGWRY